MRGACGWCNHGELQFDRLLGLWFFTGKEARAAQLQLPCLCCFLRVGSVVLSCCSFHASMENTCDGESHKDE